jgi:hypothetical protein
MIFHPHSLSHFALECTFVWSYPSPNRDGDLDAEVMLHEYTHGLSDRLVGGGVGISAFQTAGMAEGWSDFYALASLSEPGDDVNANYSAAGYVTYQWFGLAENYYYGIRRYPYTTDLNKNPLTFKDIDANQADPHAGVPISPNVGITISPDPSEVHNQGEVWCATLWEARANLIARYGYAAGNDLILQLVTDAMNLCPANPNFIQARDAILQADVVNTWGENQYDLWLAFAKRGMGLGATAPDSSTTVGVVESFDLPPVVRVSPVWPHWIDENSGYNTFTISRTGPTTSPLYSVTFYLGGDGECDAHYPEDFSTSGCYQAPFPNAFYVNMPSGQDHVDVNIQAIDDDELECYYEAVTPTVPFVPTSFGYVVDPGARVAPTYIIDND